MQIQIIGKTFLSFLFLPIIITTSAQNGTVTGRVTGEGAGLPNASVTVGVRGLSTDANGSFNLSLKPGSYAITASHVGYKRMTQSISIKANETVAINFNLERGESQNEIVVVLGSRSRNPRSNTLTPVPVDAFTAADLAATGQVEPTQMISLVAPSFNSARQTVSDGTDHIDPATLRGLGPDQVLVLLNGKRRHNTALLNVNGTVGRGSVGTDLNSLPTSAIDHVEVLRDGASSQYGSDAIAGVVNVVMRRSKGTTINAQIGQQYQGDGDVAQLGIYHGSSFQKGFLSVAIDLRYRGATNRAGDYTGPVFVNWNVNRNNGETDADYIARRTTLYNRDQDSIKKYNFNLSNNMAIGNSEVRNVTGMINGGYNLSKQTELYYSAGIGYRNGNAAGFYRYPFQTTQVIAELYPLGFLPEIHSAIWDKSISAGIKFEMNGWDWDVSNTFGGNSFEFTVKNSDNATQYSLKAAAPAEFNSGKLGFNQNTFNVDVTKDLREAMGFERFNAAFGAEWRTDFYKIVAGEEASWKNYDPNSGKIGGAQVFPGFQPSNVVNENRTVVGAYTDFEADVTNRFFANIAARFENYSDFGSSIAGKLAMRYKVSNTLSIRGAFSNGFRAPSLHQRYFSAVSTLFVNVGGVLTPRQVGTFRNESDVARAFGIPSLDAERSVNGSFGVTFKPISALSLTLDGYFIRITDRIVYTGQFSRSNPVVDAILTPYPDVNAAQFFTNAVNTETKGIDAVLSHHSVVGRGDLNLTLAGNFNRTFVVGTIKGTDKIPADQFGNVLFSRQEKSRLEESQPRSKVSIAGNYKIRDLGFMLRITRFGKVFTKDVINPALDESFDPKITTDASASYRIAKKLTATIGANNLFDIYPDRQKVINYPVPGSVGPFLDNSSFGRFIYSRNATQFGFNGGYYYLNLTLNL
jgi:iron complex outermembrane receptor protein